MQKISLVFLVAAFMATVARAQEVRRILYLAAHPDDENTRLIAHWSRAEGREVAYLSLTRGEGGQNLVGPELGLALGALREAELREARKIDGAKQFFTSAPDFGYSKSAEEAFEVWNREELLGELFRLAAEFRPDVLVTRFPPDSRAGHGHHTASAILALDLFARLQRDRMCNGDWAPKALYWNTSSWWIKESETLPKSDSLVTLSIGGYHEGMQKSVLQIGTEARSMHKSQGFGSENDHGFRSEMLQLLAGTPVDWTEPPAGNRAYQPWREVRASRPWFTDRDSLPLVRTEIVVNESPNPIVWEGQSLAKGERLERDASELEPAEYVSGDRVKGELRRPVVQADPLSVLVSPSGLIATKTGRYTLKVAFTRWALAKDFEAEVRVPKGWTLHSPKRLKWTAIPGSDPTASFEVVIEAGPNSIDGFLEFWSGGQAVRSVVKLRYDHIPQSEVWENGSVPLRFVPMNLPDAEVGVIEGAGDDAAMALEQLGFKVKRLDPITMVASDLDGLIAVVTGVRAYNSTPGMDRANALLEPWISKGGRLVMQYATASKDRTADQMGPIPFDLGRKRVTVEGTVPVILRPEHPLWNSPNALNSSDFDGWIQERGLYFAERWPAEFVPIISWSDPGEPPAEGALITAPYGQGSVTYCALSLFRQWREGVPGAYRILANLVAHDH